MGESRHSHICAGAQAGCVGSWSASLSATGKSSCCLGPGVEGEPTQAAEASWAVQGAAAGPAVGG